MLELLERTLYEPTLDQRPGSTTGPAPPKHTPPSELPPIERSATTPWPRNAKIVAVVLAVLAMLGAIGTVIGFTSGDDTTAIEQQLTDERDVALATNTQLESQLTAATDRATAAERQSDTLTSSLNEAAVTNAELTGRTEQLQMTVDQLVAQGDDLSVSNAVLQSYLATQVTATETAIAERDALAELFPMTFDASLVGAELVGTYDLAWHPAYTSGLAMSAAPTQATITATPEGYLRLAMAGFVPDAGLYRVDGALMTVVDSTTAVQATGTTTELARVAITLFPHGITVADDGTRHIDDLGATIAVSTPTGLTFYGVQFTPQG